MFRRKMRSTIIFSNISKVTIYVFLGKENRMIINYNHKRKVNIYKIK